jgi:hypothetical protein
VAFAKAGKNTVAEAGGKDLREEELFEPVGASKPQSEE